MSKAETIERDIIIDDSRLVSFMGPELRVYGTPRMLADAEMACRDLLLKQLDEGFDSVGVGVQLEHLGGAVGGDTVTVSATLKSFDGRKADFDVEVTRKGNVMLPGRHNWAVAGVIGLIALVTALPAWWGHGRVRRWQREARQQR